MCFCGRKSVLSTFTDGLSFVQQKILQGLLSTWVYQNFEFDRVLFMYNTKFYKGIENK